MDHGQILSLPGLQIVLKMGISGEKYPALAVGADFCCDARIQLLRSGEAKGPVYKVVLIIDDEKIAFHGNCLQF